VACRVRATVPDNQSLVDRAKAPSGRASHKSGCFSFVNKPLVAPNKDFDFTEGYIEKTFVGRDGSEHTARRTG
jgi:hypothetical protein